jgi:hypothetical protein
VTAVCITGMHRSGTSMVTEALRKAGLYLGRDEDFLPPSEFNPRGYFEHRAFVELNDEILLALGGAWDNPPRTPLRWSRRRLAPLHKRTRALVHEMQGHGPWGWKDPRTSLTLPFWRRMVLDLRVVVCVREPAAVADSLARREGRSRDSAIALWTEYNHRLLRSMGHSDVVTACESFLDDPERELRRLVERLGLDPSPAAIAQAAGVVDPSLQQQEAGSEELPRRAAWLRRRLFSLARK